MGRESFYLEVEMPSRMFTKELGFEILIAEDHTNPTEKDLDVFEVNDSEGTLSFDIDNCYDEEPICQILMKQDIPFTMIKGETMECERTVFTYRPTYEPVDGGKLVQIITNRDGQGYVTTHDLEILLSQEEARIKAGETPSSLYLDLKKMTRKSAVDPDDIVNKYAYETEAGSNKELMAKIDAVIKDMDEGRISNTQALEEIARLKGEEK